MEALQNGRFPKQRTKNWDSEKLKTGKLRPARPTYTPRCQIPSPTNHFVVFDYQDLEPERLEPKGYVFVVVVVGCRKSRGNLSFFLRQQILFTSHFLHCRTILSSLSPLFLSSTRSNLSYVAVVRGLVVSFWFSMEADSIVSPLVSPSYLVTWVLWFSVLLEGLYCLLFASLQISGFLQLLHRSLEQYKRFVDRPCLELDRCT